MADDQVDGDLARQRAEIESRLDRGDWVTVSDVATLFGVHHATAHRWVAKKKLIRSKSSSPAGGTAPLLCHPEDVKALLAKMRGEAQAG